MRQITLIALLITLIGTACYDGDYHPKTKKYTPPAEPEIPPAYNAKLIQHAEKAESYFNASILAFEQQDMEKSADNLENGLYELAGEGAFFQVTDRKLMDEQLEDLGTLAHLVRKGQISDPNVLKNSFAKARLFLAKEILRAPEYSNVDFPETASTTQPANANASAAAKSKTDQLPVIMLAVQELKSAAQHLQGKQLAEIQTITAQVEAVIDREDYHLEKSGKALEEVAGLLTTFLQTHQEEFTDLNVALQKASKETQETYDAHMAKLKAEIDQHTKAAQAFMKEQKEEAKEKAPSKK